MYTTSICISISYITTAICFYSSSNTDTTQKDKCRISTPQKLDRQQEILPFEMITFLQYAVHWILQLNHQHLTYLLWSQNFILWKLFELNEPAIMINVIYDRSLPHNLMWLFFKSQICTPHGYFFGRCLVTFLVYISRTSRFILCNYFTCLLSTS